MTHPISTTYLDEQIARASAALPAAGAFDATPVEMFCSGFEKVLLFIKYDEDAGATNGAVTIRIEFSPDSTGAVWHRASIYAAGTLTPGADVSSDVQREDFVYDPPGAAAEYFLYGPIALDGIVQRMRVLCAESGDVSNPGVCEVEARFS